jgi:PAS domain S-box-containing protein
MPHARANLAALIDSTDDLIWSVDLDFRLLTFNRAFVQILERSYNGTPKVGMKAEGSLPSVVAASWSSLYQSVLREGAFRIEYPMGDGRTYEMSLNPIVVGEETTGISVFAKDITAQKVVERELFEVMQKLDLETQNRKLQLSLIHSIQDVSLDGILAVSPEGFVLSANKRLFNLWRIPVPSSQEQPLESIIRLPHKPLLDLVLPLVKDSDAFLQWARELYDDHTRNDQREIELKDGRTLEHYSTTLWSEEKQYLGRIWFIRDISERKQVVQELQRSEEMFRQLAENIDAVVYMLPAKADDTLYISPTYEAIWERSREEVYRNMSLWMDAIHPEDRPAAQARFARQKQGEPTTGEYRILTPTNQVKWIRNHAFPVRDKKGEVIRICGISVEITEQKRKEAEMAAANRALRTSEQRFRDIFEQAAVGIAQTSFDGVYTSCNARFAEIIGYSIEEIPGLCVRQITAPEDLTETERTIQMMATGDAEPVTLEKRYLRKYGGIVWVRVNISVQHDGQGRALQCIVLVEDINDRKIAEQQLAVTLKALQASEESYRNAISLSPEAILIGRNHMIDVANKAALRLFGLTSTEELRGRRLVDFVGQRWRDWVEEFSKQVYAHETQLSLEEMQIRRSDGTMIDVEVSVSSFQERTGMTVQVVLRDVSERKRAEAEHARLIQGIEQVDQAVAISNIDGTIVYVNPAFERVTGYSHTEAVGANLRLLRSGYHPDSLFQTLDETLLRGENWSGELISRRKDGSQFTESVTLSPVSDSSGTVINFVSVHRDMTDELQLRKQLNQAQKMEAVGRLAGGVAHDFNNLLMVIRTYTELLQEGLSPDDNLRYSTNQVLKAVQRGASLTGQMLAFSRKQITSPIELNLNDIINDTEKMLCRLLGEGIEFRVLLHEPLWTVKADPDQIVQILMNLCGNARDAMSQGGSLTIETANVAVVEQAHIEEPQRMSPGEYVRLSVADSGVGMSKEVLREVFEPFFTTKEVGKGAGLGLATIYGIVKQSGGHVWVESEPGQGARFTLYFPKVERVAIPAAPISVNAPPRGSETILVVEDEAPLRKGICSLLSNLGYTVLSASSGDEALALASEHKVIHLLLTDVVMPRMSGRELAQILADLRPELKIIYMSGYTDDAALRYGIHELRTAFLQKPFGLSALAQKVRDSLG